MPILTFSILFPSQVRWFCPPKCRFWGLEWLVFKQEETNERSRFWGKALQGALQIVQSHSELIQTWQISFAYAVPEASMMMFILTCSAVWKSLTFWILLSSCPHIFARHFLQEIPFFLWGDPVQNPPQNPAPAGSVSSTLYKKSTSEVPEREGFRRRKLPEGGVGWTGRKRKKGCAKKVGTRKTFVSWYFCGGQ